MKKNFNISDFIPLLKPIVTVGVLGLAGFITYELIKGKKNREAKKKEKGEIKQWEKEQGKNLTFPKSQYQNFADKIKQAFDPYGFSGYGTDETSIYRVFNQLKTNDDFLELQKAFGVRKYIDYSDTIFGDELNLNMVESILKEDEGGEMQAYINSQLKKKGIKYRL